MTFRTESVKMDNEVCVTSLGQWKGIVPMKTLRIVLTCVFAVFLIVAGGCSFTGSSAVRKGLTKELNYLKNLDSDQDFSMLSYQELFPDADGSDSSAIQDIFVLFFKDFDYKIQNITLDDKSDTATVSVKLSTLDASSLARDYAVHSLQIQIDQISGISTQSLQTLNDHCRLLNHLLKTSEYKVTESLCDIPMIKTENGWVIKRSIDVENALTGGLITFLSDPFILSPEETMDVYLKAIKEMNLPEMSSFLGLADLSFEEDNDAKHDIAEALCRQVLKTFDYQILGAQTNAPEASVETQITTFDSDAIITSCREDLAQYMNSPDAVIDGYSKRYKKSFDLLLSHLKTNEATVQKNVTFILINDGISWKMESPEQSLGPALFGTLTEGSLDLGGS